MNLMRNLDRFFWGAATSAYQVEGGIKNDWSEAHSTSSGQARFDAGRTADHYNLFKADFNLAKSLGHNAHRFSIEWSRIEPEEGKFNQKEIEHYQEVISALREKGLEPFVTLWHFTNPVWFSKLGGFGSKKSAFYFERYADFVTRNLKGVKFWLTINEPMVYAANAYFRGIWPPQKKSFFAYFRVIRNLAAAHRKAYAIIHKNIPNARVGIAKNIIYFEAAGWNPGNKILKNLADWWWNRQFLNRIQNHQDFIGLNYYFHKHIDGLKFSPEKTHPVSNLGWGIFPNGLYFVLQELKKYQKPIYITENGLADSKDEKRAQFIKDHIFWMEKAIAEGADVRGYFHWSLIDNFEWDKGFDPCFGLIEVDYKTMERKVRQSAYAYRDIIKGE